MKRAAVTILSLCFFSACNKVESLTCALGSEDCPCTAKQECDPGLECQVNTCIDTAPNTNTTSDTVDTEDSIDTESTGGTSSTDDTSSSSSTDDTSSSSSTDDTSSSNNTDSTDDTIGTDDPAVPSGLGESCANDPEVCSDFEANFCSVNPLEPDEAYCTTSDCFFGDCEDGYRCCNCDESGVLIHVSACLTNSDAELAGSIGGCDCSETANPHSTGLGESCADDPEVCSHFEANFCSVNPLEPENAYCTSSPCYAGSCEDGYRCCNCDESDVLPHVSACLTDSDAGLAGGIGGCDCSETANPHSTGLGESCADDPEVCSHFEANYCMVNPLEPESAYCTTSPCSFGDCEEGYLCCDCEKSLVLPNISACLLDYDAQLASDLASCVCGNNP